MSLWSDASNYIIYIYHIIVILNISISQKLLNIHFHFILIVLNHLLYIYSCTFHYTHYTSTTIAHISHISLWSDVTYNNYLQDFIKPNFIHFHFNFIFLNRFLRMSSSYLNNKGKFYSHTFVVTWCNFAYIYITSISILSLHFWIVLYACVSRAVRGRHRKGHEDRGRSTDVEEWNDRVMPDCRLLFQLDKPDPSHPNSPCSPQFYQSTLHRNHLPWLCSFPTEPVVGIQQLFKLGMWQGWNIPGRLQSAKIIAKSRSQRQDL